MNKELTEKCANYDHFYDAMLDRAEDFFVSKTDADLVGMNRYKVLA